MIFYSNIPQNSIKVGHTYFTLPQGYEEVNSDGRTANIAKNNNTIAITYYSDTDIMGHVKNYTIQKKNDTIQTTEQTINNIKVYKSTIKNDTKTAHYWFISDNKVYEFCSWRGDQNTDNIAYDLIKSSKTTFF